MNDAVRPSDVRDAAPEPVPAMGHNQPPPYDPDVYARLVKAAQEFAAAGGEWLDLKEIATKEQAEYLVDYIAGARKKLKEVEAWRVDAKRPHDEAAKAVQAAAARPVDILGASIKKALDLLTPWQIAQKRKAEEEARKAAAEAEATRVEAERLRREAAARNDIAGEVDAERMAKEAQRQAASAERMPQTAGQSHSASGGGRTVALVTVKTARITNIRLAFLAVQNDPIVTDAIQRALNARVRARDFGGTIPGVEIIQEEKAR